MVNTEHDNNDTLKNTNEYNSDSNSGDARDFEDIEH